MTTAPFPVHPELTGIAMTYRNNRLIADSVLPRLDPLGKQEFKWYKWKIADGYTIPDTKVGRKSTPNEVEFNADEFPDKTADYGLDDLIPNTDIDNAVGQVSPQARATEGLTDLILLDREVRVAGTIFAGATYPAANQVTLAGVNQWNDAASNPINDIMTALDTPVMRPNVAIFGRATFTKLITNAKITNAVSGSNPSAGVVRRQQIAELFELDEVLVGESFMNTAKKGQTPTFSRVWGKHASFIHRNAIVRSIEQNQITFGYTAQYGTRMAGEMDEPKVGLRGSVRVRVGESVKEVVSANELGYLIINAVA